MKFHPNTAKKNEFLDPAKLAKYIQVLMLAYKLCFSATILFSLLAIRRQLLQSYTQY